VVFAFLLGGFIFFWLIGTAIFKDAKLGVLVPVGLILFGLIAFFLFGVYVMIRSM